MTSTDNQTKQSVKNIRYLEFEILLKNYDVEQRNQKRTIHTFTDTWKYFWNNYGLNKTEFNERFNHLLDDWQYTKVRVHGTLVGEVKKHNHIMHKGRCWTLWSIERE